MRREGLLLALRCARAGDLFLRRMSTGEWLGSRFQRSLWLRVLPANVPLRLREPERDLDLLDLLPADRDRDCFLLGDRDRLVRPRDRDRDARFL